MKSDLYTLAAYNSPLQAQLACNKLKSAGLWAVLADAELVSMDFLLSTAVGGVKVQVKSEDAQKAAEILLDIYGDENGLVSNDVDEEELTRQALAEPREAEETEDDSQTPATQTDLTSEVYVPDPVPEPLTERDAYARRFFFASCFSVLMFPLTFYAVYLALIAIFGSGPLSKTGKRHLAGGILITCTLSIFGALFAVMVINTVRALVF